MALQQGQIRCEYNKDKLSKIPKAKFEQFDLLPSVNTLPQLGYEENIDATPLFELGNRLKDFFNDSFELKEQE